MNKKILVTGANGFVGANLCNYLYDKGYDFSCMVRNNADVSLIRKEILDKIVYCDYTNHFQIASIVSEHHTIIHLAALTKAKYFDDFYDVNVKLTESIVQIMENTKQCKHLIYMSSQAALGPSSGSTKLSEIFKGKPISWYGISKNLAEQRVKACKKKWTIIRPASVYGEGDKDFLAYFKMIDNHISPIPGTDVKYINLIYVQDLVKLIEKCIYSVSVRYRVFHAADENIYTIEEFINILSQVMDKKCIIFRIPDKIIMKMATFLDYLNENKKKQPLFNKQKAIEITQESWLLDNMRTMKTLGLEFNSSLYENLKNTYLWYKEHKYL